MAGEADETIITRFVVESAEAIKRAQEFRAAINDIKEQLKSLPKEAKENLAVVSKAMMDAFKTDRLKEMKKELESSLDVKGVTQKAQADIQTYRAALTQALKEVRQEQSAQSRESQQQAAAMKQLDSQTKQTGQTFRLFGQEIRGTGDLLKVFFATVLGVTAVSAIRAVTQWLQQAAQAGYEFAKAMYQLGVGINVLRRSGVEITLQDMYKNLDQLGKRFGIFSTVELVQGSAALVNLIRDFGFTRDQIFKLQETIATLAVVNGRAMDEVQRTVALALSSGYTEGLQRLGVSINRVTIASKAASLGYADNYMSLTELQRAYATYLLILEKTSKYEDEIAEYQKSAPGRVDTARAAWRDFTSYIGDAALPTLAALSDILVQLIQNANDFYKAVVQLEAEGVPPLLARLQAAGLGRVVPSARPAVEAKLQERIEKAQMPLEETDVAQQDKLAQEIANMLEDFWDDLLDIQEDYIKKSEDLEQDYQDDLLDIEDDGQRKRLDLARDYGRRLQEINIREAQDIANAQIQYNLDVIQANRQAAIRRQELEEKYRENEIRAEIRFQEEMRRLREGFLFDLEEALHERDARQVLRLIRQYNLQKAQAERQYEIEKDERRRAYELELKDLERQTQERLRALAEELNARIAAIQASAQAERDAAWRKFQQDLEDQKLQEEQRKADREAQFDADMAELDAENKERYEKIAQALADQYDITNEMAIKIKEALERQLGPGGAVDAIYDYLVARINAAVTAAGEAISYLQGVYAAVSNFSVLSIPGAGGAGAPATGGGRSTPIPNPSPERQSGGPVYAGEVYKVHKDEHFIPAVNGNILNAQQSQEAVAGAYAGAGRSMDGKLKIGIDLSEGLVGSIVENTLNEVADVVMETPRKRR